MNVQVDFYQLELRLTSKYAPLQRPRVILLARYLACKTHIVGSVDYSLLLGIENASSVSDLLEHGVARRDLPRQLGTPMQGCQHLDNDELAFLDQLRWDGLELLELLVCLRPHELNNPLLAAQLDLQ